MKLPKIFASKPKKKCTYADHPTWYGKVWHFLAHEDSWASLLADAVIIFLIGKFLIFPGLGFALNTDYPAVGVISSSMDHHGKDFDEWWSANKGWYEQHNISKEQFEDFYRPNGFKKGDALLVKGVSAEEIQLGDIIVYATPHKNQPIIHRVVKITEENGKIKFSTKGDANSGQIFFEKTIIYEQIQGKAIAWSPLLGWPKVIAMAVTGQT
ncbi:signal peptidase I [Candidatus Woesearchaeota archaeon]|nr:signal peptidase I [Candidatus Woesearchaeota archaeon]